MLRENKSRFVIFPIQYEDVWKMFKRAEASFWTTAEVDLGKDKTPLGKAQRRREIFHIPRSCLFRGERRYRGRKSGDSILQGCPNPRSAFLLRVSDEDGEHSLGNVQPSHRYLHRGFSRNTPFVQNGRNYPRDQKESQVGPEMDKRSPRLFRYETRRFRRRRGIFFSGSFAAIFWLKKRGLMLGLTFSNELISRDEALHCDFACISITNSLFRMYTFILIYFISF